MYLYNNYLTKKNFDCNLFDYLFNINILFLIEFVYYFKNYNFYCKYFLSASNSKFVYQLYIKYFSCIF